jgi:hypothetical protein
VDQIAAHCGLGCPKLVAVVTKLASKPKARVIAAGSMRYLECIANQTLWIYAVSTNVKRLRGRGSLRCFALLATMLLEKCANLLWQNFERLWVEFSKLHVGTVAIATQDNRESAVAPDVDPRPGP